MTSLPAIEMLGKLLEQETEYLTTACTDSDESVDRQLTALNELWLIYQTLKRFK